MELLIDSSLWVDFFRAKTPPTLRQFVVDWIKRPEAVAAAPVVYEIQRCSRKSERHYVDATLATMPMLALPRHHWEKSADLGRACIDQGFDPGPLDLLIATVALHHDADIVTFDADYALIATVAPLKIQLLSRIVGN